MKNTQFICAWFTGDTTGMKAERDLAVASTAQGLTMYDALIAVEALLTENKESEAYLVLAQEFERPPRDGDLFSVLLYMMLRLLYTLNKGNEFERVMKIYENLELSHSSDLVRGLFFYAQSYQKLFAGDRYAALEQGMNAIALFPRACERWYILKANNILSMIICSYDFEIDEELGELIEFPEYEHIFYPPLVLKAQYLRNLGEYWKAYQELEKCDLGIGQYYNEERIIGSKINLLWCAGRMQMGDEMLKDYRVENPDYLNTNSGILLLVHRARIMNDTDGVKNAVATLLKKDEIIEVTYVIWAKYFLLGAELSDRHPIAARRILTLLDPQGDTPGYYVDWFRLYLLEGDLASAAHNFKKMQEYNGRNFILELEYAFEVKVADVAKVTLMNRGCKIHSGPEAEHVSSIEPASPAEDLSGAFKDFIGSSVLMTDIRKQLHRFAQEIIPVLITGETGTGKEEVARLLHRLSDRADAPFMAVNCASISDTLIEAELFGYKKGAFTGATQDHKGLFESAGRGTIFLDEIGSMPMSLQVSLLRVLEDMKIRPIGSTTYIDIHARVVAATNVDLEALSGQGLFRSDVFFRLNRLQIQVPSLNDRREDIPELIDYFLRKNFINQKVTLDSALMQAMCQHDWKGNVRELRNEIERMAILAEEHEVISDHHIGFSQRNKRNHVDVELRQVEVQEHASRDVVVKSADRVNTVAAEGMHNYAQYRRQQLRALFVKHKSLTRIMVVRMLGCAANTASKDLCILCDAGFIVKLTPTDSPRSSYYVLKDDLD